MLIVSLLILVLIILKYGNPFSNLNDKNRSVWNRMGFIFVAVLLILFVGITVRHGGVKM